MKVQSPGSTRIFSISTRSESKTRNFFASGETLSPARGGGHRARTNITLPIYWHVYNFDKLPMYVVGRMTNTESYIFGFVGFVDVSGT